MTRLSVAFVLAASILGFGSPAPGAGPAQGPLAPEPPPTFELDKKGKRMHLDFSMAPKPISDANMKFSHFSNRKLLVFYFSAKCPHCQHAFPYVQKLGDELSSQGLSTIAIAVKNNTEDDVRSFIRDYKVHVPVFYDDRRLFGENYGTGSIPLILMINEKGEYIRLKTFDANITPGQIKAGIAQLAQK